MKDEKLILKQSGILIIGQAVAFCINFFIPIVVVRYFSQANFGIYKQLFLIFNTLFLILQLGMIPSLYYFLPKAKEERNHYITNAIVIIALGGILSLLIVFFLFGDNILSYLNMESIKPYLLFISIYIFLMLLSSPMEALMIIDQKTRLASTTVIMSDILKASMIIFPAILTSNLHIVMYALIVFSVIRIFAFMAYLFYSNFYFGRISPRYFSPQLRYALPFGFAVVTSVLGMNLHKYAVSYFYDPSVFAIYAVGCFQIPLLTIFSDSITKVLMPKITEFKFNGEIDRIIRVWLYSHVKISIIFIPFFAFFFVMAKEVITILFTENYISSVPIFSIMVINMLLNIILSHAVLRSFGETMFILKISLLSFLLNVVIIYPLIAHFGLVGAALSTVITLLFKKISELIKIKNLLGVTFNHVLPWKEISLITLFTLISLIITSLLVWNIPHITLPISFIMSLTVFPLIYLIIIIKSSLLSIEEKDLLYGYIKRIKQKVVFS